MSVLTKPAAILIQILLIITVIVSTGEAKNFTMRNTAVNIDTYAKVDDSTSSLTGLNSFSVDGVERAWQQWFWYRVGSTGAEASIDTLPKKVATTQPTTSSLLATYTLAGKFDISVRYELTPFATGVGKASLKKTITITNTSTAALDYHLFEYSDYDISDTGAAVGDNDNIEVYNNKVYQNGTLSSGNTTYVHDSSLPPSKLDIDDGSGSIKADLTDTFPSNFSNLVIPYAYGSDKQFVKQWDLAIPAGQSVSFTITDSFFPTAPITASLTKSGTCVPYGGQADYTITFDNLANAASSTETLSNIKIIDYLPNNTAPTVIPPTDGSIYDSIANTITWSLPTLAAGSVQQTKQLSVMVNSLTDITNNVLLVSDQAFPTRLPNPALYPVPTDSLCNHPPSIFNISNASISEGGSFSTQVVASDSDNNSLTYSLSGAPVGMTISSTGLINYPSAVVGTYVITATVTDNGAGSLSASKTFTLTVIKVNKAPVITSTPVTATNDNQLYTYNVTATDADGDTLSYGLTTAPLGMSITGNVVSWTPTKAQAGTNAVQVMVNDGQGHYVFQDFNITVTHVNNPPVISNATLPAATATVGVFYSYPVVASDPDGDALSYSLTTNPTGMTIGTTGVIGWTPTTAQNNQVHAVTAQVSDGLGGIATYSFNITVGTVAKQTPVITWANPAPITYGTTLTSTQLNATANVSGTFVYSPAAGTLLTSGNKTLTATFTPTDTTTYNNATATVVLTVNKATATVTLGNLNQIYSGSTKSITATTNPAGLNTSVTYAGSSTAPTAAGSYAVVATITDADFSGSATGTLTIAKATPTVSWTAPAAVYLGTALSASQLNATASVPGTFVYTPLAGTVMNTSGNQTLSVVFTPNDAANYNGASASVTLAVNNKQTPVITWANPAAITYGTALSATQLNATSGGVAGSFVYTPAAGTTLNAGTQTLSVTFTPTDAVTYNTVTKTAALTVNPAAATVSLSALSATYDGTAKAVTVTTNPVGKSVAVTYAGNSTAPTAAGSYAVVATITDANYTGSATGTLTIAKATPTVSWVTPAAINLGTALSATQLNATASVLGSFVYTPADGTIMSTEGIQTLMVTFTPNDNINYNNANASVSITVNGKQKPVITWATPTPITYGTVLSAAQLNATANVPGDFVYNQIAGTILNAGNQVLMVTFTPADSVTYSVMTATVTLAVGKATPTISWSAPAAVDFGTTLSATQLNATANVNGSFVYTPASGTILNQAGIKSLSTVFTPADTNNYNSATATVSITVNPAPNQAPSMLAIANATITAPAGFSYQVSASDPEKQLLIYSIAGNPSGMSISNSGVISWSTSVAGTYAITVTATDPGNLSASQSFTLSVNSAPLLQAPVISSAPLTSAYEDGYYYYPVIASDPNGDLLNYSLTTKPSGMTINSTTGLIYWNPSDKGTYSVTVKAVDPSGLSATQSFKVTVVSRPSNYAPRITSTPVTTATAELPYSYNVTATDSNGDTLYYRLYSAPSGMSIDLGTGLISWIPSQSQTGSNYVTVEVVDSKGGKATQRFTCRVSANGGTANNPPVISTPGNQSNNKGDAVSLQIQASDPDGNTIDYSATGLPSGLSISSTGLISGSISNSASPDNATVVTVSDGNLSTSTSFTWTVNTPSINYPPVITSSPVTTAYRKQTYNYDVTASDPNGDQLKFELTKYPYGMTIDSGTGMITWKPSNTGTYSVTIKVSDSKGAYTTQSFSISVKYGYSYGSSSFHKLEALNDGFSGLSAVFNILLSSFGDKNHTSNGIN